MSITREALLAECQAHADLRDRHLSNAAQLATQRTEEIAKAQSAEGARAGVARLLALCEEVPPVAEASDPVKAALNGKAAKRPVAPVEAA